MNPTVDRAVGVAAVVLAVTLGGGWAAAVIISAWSEHPISSEGLSFLNNLGQTLATGVVAFLGYKVGETATASRLGGQTLTAQPPPTTRKDTTP